MGKGNNYAYLVTDELSRESVILDPANPPELVPDLDSQSYWMNWELKHQVARVALVLQSQINAGKINLKAVINTHQYVSADLHQMMPCKY